MSKKKRKSVIGKTAKKNRSTTNYTRNYPKSYTRKNTRVSKLTQVLWAVSLIVLGISGAFFGVAGISGWVIPDVVIRIIGVVDILALPVLAFTTVKKLKHV